MTFYPKTSENGILTHLVYQPKSLTQSGFVHCHCWCQYWHWYHHYHLYTPPLATGLDIETSHLVYVLHRINHSQ